MPRLHLRLRQCVALAGDNTDCLHRAAAERLIHEAAPSNLLVCVSQTFFFFVQLARAPSFFSGEKIGGVALYLFVPFSCPGKMIWGAFFFAEAVFGSTTSRIGREAAQKSSVQETTKTIVASMSRCRFCTPQILDRRTSKPKTWTVVKNYPKRLATVRPC